jgi:hypothetical protein
LLFLSNPDVPKYEHSIDFIRDFDQKRKLTD